MKNISPLAVVGKNARIADDVEVGPFAVIEDGSVISSGVRVWPHAYVCAGAEIGEGTEVHMGAVLGNLPQDLGFDKNRITGLKIGRKCVIREYATLHRSTKEGEPTSVGDGCYLMATSHIGHDCRVGNNVIIANAALLAGHVTVGDGAFISGNVVIHQFCRVGKLAIIGGFTGVNKDVPPFMLVRGPSTVRSINLVGLRRAKFPREAIADIRAAYKYLYSSGLNTAQAVCELKKMRSSDAIKALIDFIETSKRGICKSKATEEEFFE